MFTVKPWPRAHAKASTASSDVSVNVAERTIVGFDVLDAVRYDGGEDGTPSASLNGTAIASTGVEDEPEDSLYNIGGSDKQADRLFRPCRYAHVSRRRSLAYAQSTAG